MTTTHSPGVRVPPPLIFAGFLLLGLALHYWLAVLPMVSQASASWLRLVAGCFGLAALWLLAAALGGFRRLGTDPRPWREDSALVVAGIYRHTRNPMYVGMALVYLAAGLWCNSGWVLLMLAPALASIRYYVIAREERYLGQRFGAEYAAYCRQVPRWL